MLLRESRPIKLDSFWACFGPRKRLQIRLNLISISAAESADAVLIRHRSEAAETAKTKSERSAILFLCAYLHNQMTPMNI